MAVYATVTIEATITLGPHTIAEGQRKVGDKFEFDGRGERYAYSYALPHTKGILSGTLTCYDKTLAPGMIVNLPIQAQIDRPDIKIDKSVSIYVQKPEKNS